MVVRGDQLQCTYELDTLDDSGGMLVGLAG